MPVTLGIPPGHEGGGEGRGKAGQGGEATSEGGEGAAAPPQAHSECELVSIGRG